LGRERSARINELIARIDDNILVRARLLSRAITGLYDERLRPYGISSAQFALLAVINQTQPATRAHIARHQHLDKSTLTRGLKAILSEGWVEEVRDHANGRSKPIALTAAGEELLINAQPAWRAAQAEAEALLAKQGVTFDQCAYRIHDLSRISIPDAEREDGHESHQA
jgi:DNA-binding MarR family transcriptional regulator